MQLDLITPFCSANISPFDPKRKYLLSWKATIKMGNQHSCDSDKTSKTKMKNELTSLFVLYPCFSMSSEISSYKSCILSKFPLPHF